MWQGNQGEAYLTGFSESRKAMIAEGVVGDAKYRAPEMNGTSLYTAKVDVYTLAAVIQSLSRNADSVQEPLDPELSNLLASALLHDPDERTSASQICNSVQELTEGDYGPLFRRWKATRIFRLRCQYNGEDYLTLESDLRIVVQECFHINLRTYELQAQTNNKYWPLYVPFALARTFFPSDAIYDLHDDEDELRFRFRRSESMTRHYRHSFSIFYHASSMKINIRQLLATTCRDLDHLNLQPSHVQEVYGNSEIEGTYINIEAFQELCEQQNAILGQDCSGSGIEVSIPKHLTSVTPPSRQILTHRDLFVTNDYEKQVIVFNKRQMIFVRRVDGYARASQVGQADDTRFFPSGEIAQQYDDQCFFITAEIIRRLATKRIDRLFPNHSLQTIETATVAKSKC